MSEYYDSKDLPRFAEMGKDAPELWRKFNEYYAAVFEASSYSASIWIPGASMPVAISISMPR